MSNSFRKNKGFSLIEVFLTATILTIIALGVVRYFGSLFKSIDADRERIAMTNVVINRVEEWRAYTYQDLIPGMSFTYFRRTISGTGQIVFNKTNRVINSTSKVKITTATQQLASGYNYSFNLPSGPNMLGGMDAGNQVWYDGPDSTPGNNTPGHITLVLTCPRGISGILTIIVLDYNNQQREEKIYVNGVVVKKFSAGSFGTGVPLNNRRIEYTLTQQDTATGQVIIEVVQTSETNPPTFGALNPNAVISEIYFDILEGFPEHDSNPPYTVESKITSTYDDARLVPGWQITVTVSKLPYKSVTLATTISK